MELGNRIRALRTDRGITQEQLAQELHVTGQAVSKWENGLSTPDIELLPRLSVFFGVTIDELFAMTDDMHMERIRNMISDEKFLSQHDFDYAEGFLIERLRDERRRADCLELLCDLHVHRAQGHMARAGQYAREGLALEPGRKGLHSGLCAAAGGAHRDWYIHNHHALISYYQEFTHLHPDYGPGWQWLADNLIADGRLEEARAAVDHMARLMPGCLAPVYRGRIELAAGDRAAARATWQEVGREYADDWMAQLHLGDCMARLCIYDEAVEHYRRALALQPRPRYTDAPRSIAQIRGIQGRWAEAAQALDEVLALLRDEWGVSSGEGYDEPLRERDACLARAGARG